MFKKISILAEHDGWCINMMDEHDGWCMKMMDYVWTTKNKMEILKVIYVKIFALISSNYLWNFDKINTKNNMLKKCLRRWFLCFCPASNLKYHFISKGTGVVILLLKGHVVVILLLKGLVS